MKHKYCIVHIVRGRCVCVCANFFVFGGIVAVLSYSLKILELVVLPFGICCVLLGILVCWDCFNTTLKNIDTLTFVI